MNGNDRKKAEQFQKRVKEISPKHNIWVNCFRAFIVGGIICVFGQLLTDIFINFGVEKGEASTLTSIVLIFLGALLTGLDLYDNIAKYAGAGTVVPITGFANAIVSSSIEFKKEGYIFGVGSKMFTIAGPVIVYGVISSVIVGVIYFFLLS